MAEATEKEKLFAAYIEEGKKKFSCDLQIQQEAISFQIGKDGETAVMTTGTKSYILIKEVNSVKIDLPAPGEVINFERAKNGG